VPKLVWRVKLVAELRSGVMTETEVARIERDEQAGLADLGLRLAETKQLTAALQAEIVPVQVAAAGECHRCCSSCGHKLASKGYYPVTFRSLFGDVPVRVRRLLACSCRVEGEAMSFGVLDLGHDAVAPELAYVTARYAALAPFGKVAVLLSELLPISGAPNAGTVRNRTRRVGEKVVRQHVSKTPETPETTTPSGRPVMVGLDGGGNPFPNIAPPNANCRRRLGLRLARLHHPNSNPAQLRLRRHVQLAKVSFAHHGTHTHERGKGALFDRLVSIHPASPPVHRNAHTRRPQNAGKPRRGELATLIGVEDLRAAKPLQSLLQRLNAEVRLQRVRHPPRQHLARGPVHHRHQIQKAAPHR